MNERCRKGFFRNFTFIELLILQTPCPTINFFSIFYFEELSLWKSCQLLDNRVMIEALASLRDDFEDQVSLWKTRLFIRNHDRDHLVWNYQLQAKYKDQSFDLLDSTNIN